MAVATIGIAVPNFVLASLAVITFVFLLNVFPAAGWGSLQQLVLRALPGSRRSPATSRDSPAPECSKSWDSTTSARLTPRG